MSDEWDLIRIWSNGDRIHARVCSANDIRFSIKLDDISELNEALSRLAMTCAHMSRFDAYITEMYDGTRMDETEDKRAAISAIQLRSNLRWLEKRDLKDEQDLVCITAHLEK